MSSFYIYQEKMKRLVTGDLAREALEQAEDEYLMGGCEEEPEEEKSGPEFTAYKDDDGYWRLVDFKTKFNTYEELERFVEGL